AVLIPVLAMYRGFRATLTADARADRAIVLSRAQTTEYSSSLSRESVAIISDAPGVRPDARGEPLVSALGKWIRHRCARRQRMCSGHHIRSSGTEKSR